MPGKGYCTLGLKPSIWSLLNGITDVFYPGMFLPSTLIILMNEVNLGRYTVKMHRQRLDLTGKYNTLTIRADIKEWIDQNYNEHKEAYGDKYHTKSYSQFVAYFLANLFESKFASQSGVIRLTESDFEWLRAEYSMHKAVAKTQGRKNVAQTFDRFADMYVNDVLRKMRAAKEILTAVL